ncbi:MAG TPA: hypothetical protein PLL10_05660 [Elusimicrobiales bacterium]|nr:hypothetical protein [Elusimicrobiales bacterium]
MMEPKVLAELASEVRAKAVLRTLIALHGVCEEKTHIQLETASKELLRIEIDARFASSAEQEVFHSLAKRMAALEDEALFSALAAHCFPINSSKIEIWLDNFSDITEILIIIPENMLPVLSVLEGFVPVAARKEGLAGFLKRGAFYVPVYAIGMRQEAELLLLKTSKFGILRQHVPLPAKEGQEIYKNVFYQTVNGNSLKLSQLLEYLAQKGFLGYVLRVWDQQAISPGQR